MYKGYNDSDDAIILFWQVVTNMTTEEKTKLPFFWAAAKSLPQGVFQSLDPPLVIRKSQQHDDGLIEHLPTARTCYRILSFLPTHLMLC
ncbi:ubiquitin-protein ligase (E3) [Orobanche minor]